MNERIFTVCLRGEDHRVLASSPYRAVMKIVQNHEVRPHEVMYVEWDHYLITCHTSKDVIVPVESLKGLYHEQYA